MRDLAFGRLRLAWTSMLVLLALVLPGAQSTAQIATPQTASGIAAVVDFSGIDVSASNPPDLTIAAGPESVIVGSNDVVVIRDKNGVALVAPKDLRVFFASVRAVGENNVLSPRATFDPDSERFFIVAAANDLDLDTCLVPPCVSHYLLAVSTSASPATLDPSVPGPGDWIFYSLDATLDNAAPTQNFADFTDIGVNEDAVVITSVQREMTQPQNFVTSKIRRLAKSLLVNNSPVEPSDWQDFVAINVPGTANRVRAIHPAAMFGSPGHFFLTSRMPGPASNDCSMIVWSLDNLLATTTLTGKVVTKGSGCAPSPNARQQGTAVTLLTSNAGLGHTSRPVFRSGSLWDVESVQRTMGGGPVSAVRWMQLNVSAWPATPAFVQDAFIAEAGVDHFSPAIIVDAANNVVIVYGRSSSAGFPSVYVSGRVSTNALNTLPAQIELRPGTAALTVTDPAPYGQYFGAALDPADATMWVVGEFVQSANQWGAWVGNFSGPQTLTVTKQGPGSGTVTSVPGGISCPADCSEVYDTATGVTLTAAPAASSFFTGWGGACGGLAATCDVVMDAPRSVTAGFGLQSVFKFSAATYATTEPTSVTTNATVTVTRTGGTHAGATVNFATVAEVATGKATAGADYQAVSQTLTFAAGQTSRAVTIPILADTLAEGPETVRLSLTNPQGGAVLGSPVEATLTINDNDVAGSIQFVLPTFTVPEPDDVTTTRITVTRTGGAASGVTVDFTTSNGTATAGADYTAVTTTLSFAAGEVTKFVDIPILPDDLVEGDETVLLALSNPGAPATLGAQKTAVLTIRDAQTGLQFSAPTYTVSEATPTATITVLRTGPLGGTARVTYSTSDGTATGGADYTPTSGTLTFTPGMTQKTFTVPILNDTVVEGPETVLLLLSNVSGAALAPLSSATLTITDNDVGGTVKLAAATFSVSEALGAATITVSRSGGTAGGVTVDYATADQPCGSPPCPGKAQAGIDYEATLGTLTFGSGETTKTVLVPIFNDTIVEGNETFLFNLSNPQGGGGLGTPIQAVVTIVDNDQGGVVQLSAATYTVTEPLAVTTTATITLTRTGTSLASGASVQFATSNGTATAGVDYEATVTTLVFNAGEKTKTVSVPIIADGASEGDETVILTLSNPGGGATLGARTTAVLTIVDLLKVVQFSAPAYTVTEGGAATITVVRGGPTTGAVTVPYSTADGTATVGTDYTAKSGTLTFGAGVKSVTFTVATLNTVGADGARTVNLSLGVPTPPEAGLGPNGTAILTIQDNDAPGTFQFGAATYSVAEGGTSAVMITRTGGSGGAVVVQWAANAGTATPGALPTSPGADYAPTGGSLTFGPGVTSVRVPLTIVNDTLAENPETVVLEITSAGVGILGAQLTTTLTIQDNDNGGAIEFVTAALSVAENVAGGKANLMVKRTGTALAGGILVDYEVTGGTAGVGDFTLADGTLTFAAGQTSALIQVTILNDAVAEANETVIVTLSNPRSSQTATGANAPTLGATTSTTLTITDEEPRLAFGAAAYSVTEGGSVLVPVMRTGPTTGTVSVDVAGVNGTATFNTDFTISPPTLTFGPGVTKLNVTVAATEGATAEGAEQATLQLTNPIGASLGAISQATLTIQDNESAGTLQFSAAAASVVEGRTVRVTVTRTGANLTGGVSVGWSATGGTATFGDDFTPESGTLNFGPGVTTQSFDIETAPDALVEGTETIVLSLDPPSGTAVLGTPSAATVFIVDEEQSVAFSRAAFTVGETVPQAVITVVRLGVPEDTVMVTASTVTANAVPVEQRALPGTDYTSVSGVTLTFGPGEIVKTFSIPILTGNALTRNINRVVGLELSSPNGAALGATSEATLTILDFRPDLVVTTVSTPAGALAGKLVSAPTTVRNLGMVPAPAFRVGLFISPDDPLPGTGTLLTLRDVPSLAPGASMALPTQLNLADDFPAGDYFVSAVADFSATVGEADENNNGTASAPSFIKISQNFTKFQSASASLSQSSPPPSGPSGLRRSSDLICDAPGAINLSGTFTVTSQQEQNVTGVADLTGTLNSVPVRYVVAFDGTAQNNNSVIATLTSISATGAFIGSGSGSFTGSLDGRILSGTVSGTINTSTGGACVFTGSLTAEASTSFLFKFATRIQPGSFSFGTTPDADFPVTSSGYAAAFTVLFDEGGFPDPSAVRFTGPAGSGLSNTPADSDLSGEDEDGRGARYVSPPRDGNVPGGTWSVLYKGTSRSFVVPPLNFNTRLVVIDPTVTVNVDGNLTAIDWVYRDRVTGDNIPVPPSFIKDVQVELHLNGGMDEVKSPLFDRTVTRFDLSSTPQIWAEVRRLSFVYTDLAGNSYIIEYGKSFNIQVEARLENVYGFFTSPGGSQERLLHVFVDVPADSVNPTPCGQQSGPDYFVSVVNEGASGPFQSPPRCIPRTGTTQFDDDPTLTDIFSIRQPLTGPQLGAGTPFRFRVAPQSLPVQDVVATLRNREANTPGDFIFIPNSSTPSLKPAGTDLADARLGQNMTVSWSLPGFEIAEQFFSPIVNLSDGRFCSGVQQDLAPGTTSTTFKFPSTCFGEAPVKAQFCIFFDGVGGERSSACWFFEDAG